MIQNKDSNSLTQLLRDEPYNRLVFVSPKDVLNLSYGPFVDRFLGKRPRDFGLNYVFRRFTYSAAFGGAVTGSPIHMTYRHNRYNMCSITEEGNAAPQIVVNMDAPTVYNLASTVHLRSTSAYRQYVTPGSYIVGAIMKPIDSRSKDTKTGEYTASMFSEPSLQHWNDRGYNGADPSATSSRPDRVELNALSTVVHASVVDYSIAVALPTLFPVGPVPNDIDISGISTSSASSIHTPSIQDMNSVGTTIGIRHDSPDFVSRLTFVVYALVPFDDTNTSTFADISDDNTFLMSDLNNIVLANPVVTGAL
jgi:hypothetical protein